MSGIAVAIVAWVVISTLITLILSRALGWTSRRTPTPPSQRRRNSRGN